MKGKKEWLLEILIIAMVLFIGTVLVVLVAESFRPDDEPEYAIVEDNAVETIISVDKGDEITLLSINRFEDGGGLWEVTYDGKSEPKTRRVE